MAIKFKPNTFDISRINGGNRIEDSDGVLPSTVNAPIEAAAYAQSLATNPPEYIEDGYSPSVSIGKANDGTPKFEFRNIRGASGGILVNRTLIGQDENGGNIYLDTYDNGTTAQFIAPRGPTGDKVVSGVMAMEVSNGDLILYQSNIENAKFSIGEDGYMRIDLGE